MHQVKNYYIYWLLQESCQAPWLLIIKVIPNWGCYKKWHEWKMPHKKKSMFWVIRDYIWKKETDLEKKKNREETAAPTSAENFTSDCDKRTGIHQQQRLKASIGPQQRTSHLSWQKKEMLQGFL